MPQQVGIGRVGLGRVLKKIPQVLILAFTLPLSAFAASVSDYPVDTPAGGIGGSRHNMGSYGRVITTVPEGVGIIPVGSGLGTTEICVFCHTPHHTNTAYGVIPMWNRAVLAPSSYSTYGTTIAGTSVSTVGSTTLACLSCHDGVTTFDSIVNAPGKDGVVPGGSDRNYLFMMPGGFGSFDINALHSFNAPNCESCHVAAMGGRNPAIRLNIGTDLSNDHPVSVQYNGGAAASLRPVETTISSINLTAGLHPSAATAYGNNLSQNRWAVNGFVSNTATIQNLLRDNKVECSSCHDPHFRNLSWDEAEPTWYYKSGTMSWDYCSGEACSDGNFLRRVGGNTGSGVCRTCHNK